MIDDVLKFIDDKFDDSIEDLKALCRLPSVAAKGEYMEETAEIVVKIEIIAAWRLAILAIVKDVLNKQERLYAGSVH